MEVQGPQAMLSETPVADARITIEDLRLRLRASQGQERAARAKARCLARELALARRLLGFSYGAQGPTQTAYRPPPAGEIPRVRAASLSTGAIFTLDSWQSNGSYVVMAGWAFVPVPAWNGLVATATVLFRQGHETHAAAAGRVFRPDVAAHFAAQPGGASGGARGLAGVGFACDVAQDSLPPGIEWEIVLRLECDGLACEQPTGQHLRL